jgi:hypothetical protein
MSKVASMTRTQNSYSVALAELGFTGGMKKESLSMTLDLATVKIAVKVSENSSIKIVTTDYKAEGKPKETTQTFFPPASDFSSGVVLGHVNQILGK